jgi:hypothetical protein
MIDDPQILVPKIGNRPVSRWRTIMSGHPEDGHRQGYRFRTGVHAEVLDNGRTFACEAQNLSRSGVLLVGDLPAPSGDTVDVALKAPTGSLTIRLTGRVIRCQPGGDGAGLSVALEFVDMDDARRDALEVLVARLLESPPAGSTLDQLKPGASPQDIKAALEAIPLPQRIALASRIGLKEREFLRFDTNPAVLESLAHNPNLGIVEARALAASTFLMPGTLDSLASNQRFKDDEELRMAIAVHPRVSLLTAEKATASLKLPQIKKLLAKPGLNQILREKLFRRTTQR